MRRPKADRPAPEPDDVEIEITPEMMRAGGREIAAFDKRYEDENEAAIRVYRAMIGAREKLSRRR